MRFPLAFVVAGTPPSVNRSGPTAAWQRRVRRQARRVLPRRSGGPSLEELIVRLTFCFDETSLDIDNFIKPTLDALIGIVYVNDSQISDVIASGRTFDAVRRIDRPPPRSIEAVGKSTGDFVHVTIDRADPRRLPWI